MNQESAEKAIEGRLQNNWGTTVIDINPNVDFSAPSADESFIKLNIINRKRIRKNIGSYEPVYRQHGSIIIKIHTPKNKGTRLGKSYGDTIAAIFREQKFDCIICREATVDAVGEFDGRWITNVVIFFYWDSGCIVL